MLQFNVKELIINVRLNERKRKKNEFILETHALKYKSTIVRKRGVSNRTL